MCTVFAFCKNGTGGNCTQLPLSINIELLRSVHIPHFLSTQNCQYLHTTSTFYQYRSVSVCPHPPLFFNTELAVSVHRSTFYWYRTVIVCSQRPLSISTEVLVSVHTHPPPSTFYRYRTVSICPNTPLSIDTELSVSVQIPHFLSTQNWQCLHTA